MHCFGKWEDPDGALKKYLEQKDALHAGRTPRADPEAVTVKELANAFLNTKQRRVDVGELSPRTWVDYKDACDAPVRYDPDFNRPSKKTLRLHRAKQGVRLFTAEEIRRLLDAAGTPLRALMLLVVRPAAGMQITLSMHECTQVTR